MDKDEFFEVYKVSSIPPLASWQKWDENFSHPTASSEAANERVWDWENIYKTS